MNVCYNKLFKRLIDKNMKKEEFGKAVGIGQGIPCEALKEWNSVHGCHHQDLQDFKLYGRWYHGYCLKPGKWDKSGSMFKKGIDVMHTEPNRNGVCITELTARWATSAIPEHRPLTDFWRVSWGLRQETGGHRSLNHGRRGPLLPKNEDFLYAGACALDWRYSNNGEWNFGFLRRTLWKGNVLLGW